MSLIKRIRYRSVAMLALLAGLSAPRITPATSPVPDIPIQVAVYAVTRSNGNHMTYIDVVVDRAFDVDLPAGIESIKVTGPRGPLAIGREDFNYNPQWRAFWYARPGPPETGRYRVGVTGGARHGAATALHSMTRPLPIPDATAFEPRWRETLTCDKPLFNWSAVDEKGPLYYQLQIRAADHSHVFRTGYVRDMRSFRLAANLILPGNEYQWRVRVADGPDWQSLDNRSQSRWRSFSVDESSGLCAYRYRRPMETDDGWSTAGLDDEQIDREEIEQLLGAVIRNVSDQYADQFAEQHLFGPLSISEYRWLRHRDSALNTGGGLQLRPRDMAKIGQLMLDRGRWASRRVVSPSWVEESTRAHVSRGGNGYGYQWYRGKTLVKGTELDAFWAWGYGGQFIFVFPQLELVAVFTSRPVDAVGHYVKEPGLYQPFHMLGDGVLPAVVATDQRAGRPIDKVDLDLATGSYQLNNGAIVTVLRAGDGLVALRDGEKIMEMTAVAGGLLTGTSTEIGEVRIRARRDAAGLITGATLYHFPFSSQEMVKIE